MSMKVLIISDAWHPQINGVVRTYEHIRKELNAMNHQVEIISPANFNFIVPMPFYPEIKLVITPDKRLKRIIKDYKPDKIHIATEGPLGWAGRKYCLNNNMRYTTCYHTQFPDYIAKRFAWLPKPLYNIVHSRAVNAVKKFHDQSVNIMVSTQSLKDQLVKWDFKAPTKFLSRGVDFSVFYPSEKTILKDLKQPIALFVGRLSTEKNIEAFLDMKWSGSKVVVGNGPARNILENKYTKALFVGKKTGAELADYYRSSDIFVFPSKTDTFGIVLIEAIACGLPVAAYNVMGPKDIITHDYLGALDDDLSKAAYQAIEQVEPIKSVQHIKDNYSWKTAGKQFIDAL